MSAAFLACASVALLLFLVLLGSLAVLKRLERRAGDGLDAIAARGERHRGPSSDVHLFLGVPDAAAVTPLLSGRGDRVPEAQPAVVSALRDVLPVARQALVEYGHFREISVRHEPDLTVAYVYLRLRTPVDATFDPRDRRAWSTLFDHLDALGPDHVVSLLVRPASRTTDRAAPTLVPLDPPPVEK